MNGNDVSALELARMLDNLDEIKRNSVVSSHRDAIDEVAATLRRLALSIEGMRNKEDKTVSEAPIPWEYESSKPATSFTGSLEYWKQEHARVSAIFQQGTLRNSELTTMLRKFITRLNEQGHRASHWAHACDTCLLMEEAEKLIAAAIDQARGTT